MEEVVKCPICNKRVFDLKWKDETTVATKCRHCNNIVSITRDASDNSAPPNRRQMTLPLK